MSIASDLKKRLSDENFKTKSPDFQSLLQSSRERATGKAAQQTGPRASTVQQDTAYDLGQAQQAAVAQQGMVQAEAIGAEEDAQNQAADRQRMALAQQERMGEQQRTAQMQLAEERRLAQLDEGMERLDSQETMALSQLASQSDKKLRELEANRNMSLADIWRSFGRSEKELEFREDAAEMEQLAFNLRLQDKQYLDGLARVGKLRGLEDAAAFKREITSTVLGERENLLRDNLSWRESFDKSAREFAEEISSMEIAQALSVAESAAKQAAVSSVIQGAGQLGTAYANRPQAGASAQSYQESPTYTPSPVTGRPEGAGV